MVRHSHHQPHHRTQVLQPSRIAADIELAASGDTEARDRLRVTALRLRWMGLSRDAAKMREILSTAALTSSPH